MDGKQMEFRVFSREIAQSALTGWMRTADSFGEDYRSLRLCDHFRVQEVHCNFGKAAGQDDEDVYAGIWSPAG